MRTHLSKHKQLLQGGIFVIALMAAITAVVQLREGAIGLALIGGLAWARWHFRHYGEH
jgi:hypothetical protein